MDNFQINITDRAAQEVKTITIDCYVKSYLRIRVQGGGCSGFKNKMAIDENYNEKTDVLISKKDINIVIDKRSAIYLENATIDFTEELNDRGFKITNPAAKSTCGCGSSYSI
jgi:iron-sulfur cluster assembly accessory protein